MTPNPTPSGNHRHNRRLQAARTDLQHTLNLLAWLTKHQTQILDIIRRDNTPSTPDGYPTRTIKTGNTTGNTDTSVERAALQTHNPQHDIVHTNATRIETNLQTIITAATAIQTATQTTPHTAPNDDSLWCISCLRAGIHTPRAANRNSRCQWCRNICQTYGLTDPPLALLKLHHDKRRLTEADMAKHLPQRKPTP